MQKEVALSLGAVVGGDLRCLETAKNHWTGDDMRLEGGFEMFGWAFIIAVFRDNYLVFHS